VRPLRFATVLATITVVAILFGHLWLRSIDGHHTISLGEAAREGSDAVGVAITDLNRRIRPRAGLPAARSAAARKRVAKQSHRASVRPRRASVQRAAPVSHALVIPVSLPVAVSPKPTAAPVPRSPKPKPKPKPKPVVVAVPQRAPQAAASRSTQRTAPVVSKPAVGGILGIAAQYAGIMYVYGGTTPAGFDCSGYTSYVFRQVGINLPRTAEEQRQAATPVSNPQPGDLVFFGSPAYHVGIYAGNGMMWDSPRTGKAVALRSIWSSAVTYGRP
jgi:peptidoglycan DL-endopeptidase CwlO